MVLEWLVPKEKEFYVFFEEQAKLVVEASEKLSEILGNYSGEKTESYASEMVDIEDKAREIETKIYAKTVKSFMTPIDTERIIGLAKGLGKIVSKIEVFTTMCKVYGLTDTDDHMLKFGNLLKETSLDIQKNISYLKDAEKKKEDIKNLNEKIWAKEKKGDEIFKVAMKELFKSSDAIRIIKIKDIYDTLEDAMDASEKVADEMSEIVIKLA